MCVHPLSAWQLLTVKTETGRHPISFQNPFAAFPEKTHKALMLPCGQCVECRLQRSRHWAMRCMHEASLYPDNAFITLTFNDDHVDRNLSLKKEEFPKFMKRLRTFLDWNYWEPESKDWVRLPIPFSEMCAEKYSGVDEVAQRVRFFHAGEYGEEFGRPHHHAIIFNFGFPDKKFKKRSRLGFPIYESELLKKLWSDPETGDSKGFHEIQDVTYDSCAYVARYVMKKVNGEPAEDHYSFTDEQGNVYKREPEFCTMSRHPGIGLEWYEKYRDSDVFAHDKIYIKPGVEITPPRYYGSKYELSHPQEYAIVKEKRLQKAKDNPDNYSRARLRVREVVKKAQLSQSGKVLK